MFRNPLRKWFDDLDSRRAARFLAFLERRSPPSKSHQLHQNNVFIFPSKEGLIFTFLLIVLLVAAINYKNSLVYLLVFLLGAMFLATIFHTFRNLAGLELRVVKARPGFVGQVVPVTMTLAHPRHAQALLVGFVGVEPARLSLPDKVPFAVTVAAPAHRRGRFEPDRLLVETFYPLGLLRAWSWLRLEVDTVVWPRPIYQPLPEQGSERAVSDAPSRRDASAIDFYGLREHRSSDSPRAIAWRQYARSGTLAVKEFASGLDDELWLEFDSLAAHDLETRLSILAGWVLQLAERDTRYGLRLPGLDLPIGSGEGHRQEALTRLALYALPTTEVGVTGTDDGLAADDSLPAARAPARPDQGAA